MPRPSRPRRLAIVGALVLGLAALGVLAVLPTTTRQGVNFVVTTHALPAYVKALDFIDRDLNYRHLARRIVAGESSAKARVLAVFEWTQVNIRDTPPGLPIVDDHVWHIIVRGHGVEDQKADVFTTLAAYAGVPAYWIYAKAGEDELPISLALVDGRWRVFDVAHRLIFRDARGELLAVDELAKVPSAVARLADGRTYRNHVYTAYFEGFHAPTPPDVLRPEMQMLWPRLWFEAKRSVGLGGRQWDPDVSGHAAAMPHR